MVGLYGPIVFVTGVVIDDMKKTVTSRWGTHEIWQGKPMLEYAGAALIELSFKMMLLKPYTMDPLMAIIALQEIMDLATPLPLILGIFPMGRGLSLFVMESLEVQPEYFFQGGGIMGATCEVKLKEYPTPSLIDSLKAALGGGSTGTGAATPGDAGAATSTGAAPDTNAGALPDSTVADEQPPPSSFDQSVPQTGQTGHFIMSDESGNTIPDTGSTIPGLQDQLSNKVLDRGLGQ